MTLSIGCRRESAGVDTAGGQGMLEENQPEIADMVGVTNRPVEAVCADPTACRFVVAVEDAGRGGSHESGD